MAVVSAARAPGSASIAANARSANIPARARSLTSYDEPSRLSKTVRTPTATSSGTSGTTIMVYGTYPVPRATAAAKSGSLRQSWITSPTPVASTRPAMPWPGRRRIPTTSSAPAPQAAW